MSVSDSADTTTGGIVGINHGTLINCQFTGVVTGDSEVGGIVGRNESEGTIDHSTARAIVTGKSSTGGIAGSTRGGHQHRISGSLSRHRRLHGQDGGLYQQQDGRRR